jgi:REP element-mobilizing transposase RayT
MARLPRLLIPDSPTVYHVMSKTALPGLPFDPLDKDDFLARLKTLSKIYFTEILGFCLMDNHFHLLVRVFPSDHVPDDELADRYRRKYGEGRVFPRERCDELRRKWSSLPEFVKELKQTFSRRFNKRRNRRGYLWNDRYKSEIVQDGNALLNCLAYIDLNPIRAAMVDRPEEYRWCSLGYHVQSGNRDGLLSLDFGHSDMGGGRPSGCAATGSLSMKPGPWIRAKGAVWMTGWSGGSADETTCSGMWTCSGTGVATSPTPG